MKKIFYPLKIALIIFIQCISHGLYAFTTYPADLEFTTGIYDVTGLYLLDPNIVYNYNPADVSAGLPMIKIVGSNFVLDGQGAGLYNLNTTVNAWTAIEIGWSPTELAADPTRVQPKNITIKNISFNQFSCGIIVHEGIKNITLENININDTAVGIIFAGQTNEGIKTINIDGINIFGDETNQQAYLVALKTLIEQTDGYGTNYFMTLIADPNDSGNVDVYPYYGIWCNKVSEISLSNILVKDVGYNYKTYGSAGNGMRTQTLGIVVINSRHIDMNNVVTNEIFGEINAIGLNLDNDSAVTISNSKFSFNTGGQLAVGLQVTNNTAAPYSVISLELDTIDARNHLCDTMTKGMDLSSVQGLVANNLSCNFNNGFNQTYGLYINGAATSKISNSTCNQNETTNTTNNISSGSGIAAYGFYANNINGLEITNMTFNGMQGLNAAYGLYLATCSSCLFTNCEFTANIATEMRLNEASDIRSQQDAQEISKHAPIVAAANTGGYGVYAISSNYIKFESCLANSNTGHRAIGLNFLSCRSVAIFDTFASTQTATGTMIDSSFITDNIANPSAIAIKTPNIPLLFGGIDKSTVDAVTTTDLFLQSMSSIRASQVAGNPASYSDLIAVTATTSLLEAMIARYRVWGVAIGIHGYDVTGFLLNNCTCGGNSSFFDSGIGLCFTGRNTDHTIRNSNLMFNVGNLSSLITAATNPLSQFQYSYNLMGMKPFWTTLLQTDVWTVITNNSLASAVNSVALSPNGDYLAAGLANDTIIILNPATGATIATLTATAPVTSVTFSADGTLLAAASDSSTNNIQIWTTSNWTNTQNLTHTGSSVNAVAFNASGTELASGATATTNNINIWSTTSWTTTQTLTHGSLGVNAVTFSPDGTLLATGSQDTSNNVEIWSTSSWTNTQTLSTQTNAITSLAFNPAATLLASASQDTTIAIWTVPAWTLTETISAGAGSVNAVGFKNDGTLLASGHADDSLRIWSTTNWSSVITLTNDTQPITSLAWSADGRRIATGSLDDTAKYYSTNIYSKAATTTAAGIYNVSTFFTAQGQREYGDETSENDVFIRLKSQDRAFISPIGPDAAGIIMGDLLLEGVVQNCNLFGNVGNAGNSVGLMLDNAYSLTIDSNLISGNIANVYGQCVGIVDRTAHSPNLFIRNFLEGNKCSIFNNSNYFVPFNPADPNNLSLPITTMMNGSFINLNTLYDNVIINYSQNPQFYSIEYLSSIAQHPDLVAYWTTNDCWS